MTYVGTPQSITAEVGRTTAMMGVQTADFDGLNYSWSYQARRHRVDHVRAVRRWNERGMAGRQPVFSLERKGPRRTCRERPLEFARND
jgi:hypothetical protein